MEEALLRLLTAKMQKADGYENFMGFYQKRIPADLSRSQQYFDCFYLADAAVFDLYVWHQCLLRQYQSGLKLDDANPRVVSLARSFSNNQYIRTKVYDDKDAMYSDIVNSKLQGAVIVPNDFTVTLNNGRTAQILVITDGSETNTANYVQSYASGVIYQWLERPATVSNR